MINRLSELLSCAEVADAQQVDGLQVFGLRYQRDSGLTYLTLDEGLAAKTLEVKEINEAGSVPVLKVINHAEAMVFLMAGEQLIGAKQNRVVNASMMVAGKSDLPIPVSCVEAGRWRYRSPAFASFGTMAHGALRKLMSQHAHEGYRSEGTPSSKQGEVWREVACKLGGMGSVSPSLELQQIYEDYRSRLQDFLKCLQVPQGCGGAAFVMRGRIAGADLFDKPATLSKLWPKLVRSFAVDALEESARTHLFSAGEQAKGEGAAPITGKAVCDWLQSAGQAKAEPFQSPGLGQDIRLEGKGVAGAALVVDGNPVHVELFS